MLTRAPNQADRGVFHGLFAHWYSGTVWRSFLLMSFDQLALPHGV
jgi:hypothetical protein